MSKVKRFYSKLRRNWNYTINDLSGIVGLNKKFFHQARGARIVVHHGLCQTHHTRFNTIFLKVKTFEKHLEFYKRYFNVISLDDYYNRRFNKDHFNICLTFDDGFANNYKYVLPLMNKYKVPITFFVTAIRAAGYDILWNDLLALAQKYGPSKFEFGGENFSRDKHGSYVSSIEGKSLKDILRDEGFERKTELIKILEPLIPATIKAKEEDYWLQMTQEEIKSLSHSSFANIGCHGFYHNDLAKIPIDKVKDEIILARRFLENTAQKEIKAIAFPYGSYSREVASASKAVGFNQLLATEFLFPEDHSDVTMRERFTVNPYISVNNQMLATIYGKYYR